MDWNCLRVLDRCARSADLEFDPVAVQLAVDRIDSTAVQEGSQSPLDLVRGPAEAVGFQSSSLRLALSEAVQGSSPHSPVLLWNPAEREQESGWLALLGFHRGQVLVNDGGEDRSVSIRELARGLRLKSSKDLLNCVVLQPSMPCSHAAIAQNGHGNSSHGAGENAHGMPPTRRLLGLIRPERRDIRTVIGYAMGVGVLSLAAPLAIEALVSTVALTQLRQQLIMLALVLFVCLALASAFRGLQNYVVEIIQRRLFVRVASDLAYRLPRTRIEAFDNTNGPELVNRFFDILTVQKVGALLLLDGIAIVLQAFFGLAILASYSPYLLGFDIVVLAALAFLLFVLGHDAVRTSIQESLAKYAVAGYLEEIVRVPLAFKITQGTDYARLRTDSLARRYLETRRSHFAILMRQIIFALGFQAFATAALLGLGGWLVLEEQLTLGQLVAAELIVATVIGSFAKLGKHLEGWYDLLAATDKLGHLWDLPLERAGGEQLERMAEPATLEIRSLSYGFHSHSHVLQEIDLIIHGGEKVALIGSSGSGKSTLLEIIQGLRLPEHGAVLLDHANIRDLSLESVRQQSYLVSGIDILDETILQNLRVGRPGISMTQINPKTSVM